MQKSLLCILLLGLAVRLTYIRYAGGDMVYEPDSQGYYVEKNFFTDDFVHNFFSHYRTPGYRMITSVIILVSGKTIPLYNSAEFFSRTIPLLYVQTAAGLIGLIFLYDLLLRIGISKITALTFTGFTALNIYQFMWERAYLTESLYIAISTILLWLFVQLLSKPTIKTGLLFVALAIYGFLLRPGGVAIPFILLPLVYIAHRTKKVFMIIILLLSIYSAAPLIYTGANAYLYRYPGISINTDFAVFGRILRYTIPVGAAAQSTPVLFNEVERYRQIGGNIAIPWYFFVFNNNRVYTHMDELRTFDRLVIKDQITKFMGTVLNDIPRAFFDTDVDLVLPRTTRTSPEKYFFDSLARIIGFAQQTTILFLFLFPCTMILAFYKPTRLHIFLLGIGLLELYQLFSSLLFGGAWEFSRHMIVTQTYLFFFYFWWIGILCSWIKAAI